MMDVIEELCVGVQVSEQLWNRKPKEIILSVAAFHTLRSLFSMYFEPRMGKDEAPRILGVPYSVAGSLPDNSIIFRDRDGYIYNAEMIRKMLDMDISLMRATRFDKAGSL